MPDFILPFDVEVQVSAIEVEVTTPDLQVIAEMEE
jgi:hypothetical protein